MNTAHFLHSGSAFLGRLDVASVVRRCVAGGGGVGAPHYCCCRCCRRRCCWHRNRLSCTKKGAHNRHGPLTISFSGRAPLSLRLHFEKSLSSSKMIKNGHHHHQVNTAAGKDAGATPGAAACSPEKRRRRIRVWCDGWWVTCRVIGRVVKMPQRLLLIVCGEHVWMSVSAAAGTGLLQVAELSHTGLLLHPEICTKLLIQHSLVHILPWEF